MIFVHREAQFNKLLGNLRKAGEKAAIGAQQVLRGVDSVKKKFFPDATRESLLTFMTEIKEASSPDGMTSKKEHDFIKRVFVEAGVIKGEALFEEICNRAFVTKANEILEKK